jgi:hypothetical protein
MEIDVVLFGSLRRFMTGEALRVACDEPPTVREIKELVTRALDGKEGFHQELITRSAVATESRVLGVEEQICGAKVMLLPPVCGG